MRLTRERLRHENLNGQVDPGEKRIYFEVSAFSTYVFFEDPR